MFLTNLLAFARNSNIVKLFTQEINELMTQSKQVKIICIGKKGHDLIRRSHEDKIIDFISLKEVKNIAYSDAEEIGNNIVARFEEGEFDVCKFYYSSFKSVISQIPIAQQLIPLPIDNELDSTELDTKSNLSIYDYEPEESDVMEDLLPLNLNIQVFQLLYLK